MFCIVLPPKSSRCSTGICTPQYSSFFLGKELIGIAGRIVLQYMTDGDNPNMRDGTDQDSAGGDGNDPTEEVAGGSREDMDNDFRGVSPSGGWF